MEGIENWLMSQLTEKLEKFGSQNLSEQELNRRKKIAIHGTKTAISQMLVACNLKFKMDVPLIKEIENKGEHNLRNPYS